VPRPRQSDAAMKIGRLEITWNPKPLTLEGEICALLSANLFVAALKLYRARTGSTLRDAKVAVERLGDK